MTHTTQTETETEIEAELDLETGARGALDPRDLAVGLDAVAATQAVYRARDALAAAHDELDTAMATASAAATVAFDGVDAVDILNADDEARAAALLAVARYAAAAGSAPGHGPAILVLARRAAYAAIHGGGA